MKQRKWFWGLLIGIGIAILTDLFFVFFVMNQTLCIEALSCQDKLLSFLGAMAFFAPAGAISGLFFGLVFEKRFYLALLILLVGIISIYFIWGSFVKQAPTSKMTTMETRHIAAFEEAINKGDFAEVGKHLAGKVAVSLEGSGCCGEISRGRAIEELKRLKGTEFTFYADENLVKQYDSYTTDQYPDGRIISRNPRVDFNGLIFGFRIGAVKIDKEKILGYKASVDGKIYALFIDVGVDKQKNDQQKSQINKNQSQGMVGENFIPEKGQIQIIYPNGGEKLEIGKTYNIRWSNYSGKEPLTIAIQVTTPDNKGYRKVIASDLPAISNGNYDWKVDLENSDNKYKIEVYPESGRELIGRSKDYFAIIPSI